MLCRCLVAALALLAHRANCDKSFAGFSSNEQRYAEEMSTPLTSEQKALLQETLSNLPNGMMAGAPEVLRINSVLARSVNAVNALDVGLFSGSSALATALVLPPNGKVIGIDIDSSYWNNVGQKHAVAAGVADKIQTEFVGNDAGNVVLDRLIADGRSGTFDFCFIDADKGNYPNYYRKCMQLLRSGGVLSVDNVIWGASAQQGRTGSAEAIHEMNQLAKNDPLSYVTMLPIAQGLLVAYKL